MASKPETAARRMLTKPQLRILEAALRKGGGIHVRQQRTGGAVRRCCERMAGAGLLAADPPFAITRAGVEALRAIYCRRVAVRGAKADFDDLARTRAALDSMAA